MDRQKPSVCLFHICLNAISKYLLKVVSICFAKIGFVAVHTTKKQTGLNIDELYINWILAGSLKAALDALISAITG